jgi:multidrug efflux pump subunit AcrB
MQANTTYRALISDMNKYYVRNHDSSMVPLSTLISYRPSVAAPLITHFNIFRSAEVDGAIPDGYSSGQSIVALKHLAETTLPRGYTYEFSGLSYEELKAGSLTVYIFLFSIIFVFLFLAALYESWSVPFSVMLAVPISAFGAILALTFVPSLTNNVYAQIGLITLIGLSAKNAILIVEFAKVRVDRGEELIKSTLEAVRLRLRPIIMTSLAFIFGRDAACTGNRRRCRFPKYYWSYCSGRHDSILIHFDIYCACIVCTLYPIFLWQKRTSVAAGTS